MGAIRFPVQGAPETGGSWLELARSAEAHGFESLYVADHPGTAVAPFVALAAAAAVTERVRLGTCVVNAGVWERRVLGFAADRDGVTGVGRTLPDGHRHLVDWSLAGVGERSRSFTV